MHFQLTIFLSKMKVKNGDKRCSTFFDIAQMMPDQLFSNLNLKNQPVHQIWVKKKLILAFIKLIYYIL
jgi:hypothetical protein